MPNGVKAKGLDLGPLTKPLHELHTLFEGLAVLLPAESAVLFADEDMGAVFECAVVPPPVQGFSQFTGHGQPVILKGTITPFLGIQADTAVKVVFFWQYSK